MIKVNWRHIQVGNVAMLNHPVHIVVGLPLHNLHWYANWTPTTPSYICTICSLGCHLMVKQSLRWSKRFLHDIKSNRIRAQFTMKKSFPPVRKKTNQKLALQKNLSRHNSLLRKWWTRWLQGHCVAKGCGTVLMVRRNMRCLIYH